MNKYNELRKRINRHCPHLLELSFGCEIEGSRHNITGKVYVNSGERIEAMFGENMDAYELDSRHYKILGHPPTLADVLVAIEIVAHVSNCYVDSYMRSGLIDVGNKSVHYNLTLPLSEQSDETLSFLLKVID